MQISTIEQMKIFSPEKMKKTKLFDTDRMFCDLYCFEPEQFQKPHAHDGQDKVYIVLEGEGCFQVDEEEKTVAKGSAVLAPSGSVHGVKNRSSKRLVLLVFMAPKPEHG
ncbi:MAG: cupin domain-containing protein [Nitrospiria bacterium]